ncbi:hypothetical protein E4665_14880 [Sporolactobacillus shoreae]|uniref:Peptidoglycan binding domain-containing protein n=1 Tax=Sporolactobacillus shoreae TaxID=1465501 RepID=A0A4Z0GJ08_9BACL|nr:VanW family protein [Sporolactobacillus shoreae]TGA96578.1 hypothetical protein E4665_14880 [Sporolactobacillus shoreae]
MIQMIIAGFLLLAQPATLQDSLTITEHGQIIAQINRAELAMPFPVGSMIDHRKYQQLIHHLEQKVNQAPINAGLDDQGRIIPEKNGRKLSKMGFKDQFNRYFFGHGPVRIEIPLVETYPKVDSELLAHIRVQKIGQYVTFFNAGNESRSHNILLAAQAIDNHVVFPNEVFSFNQVVGQRTTQKGYRTARIIVRGEYSEGVGGGICQVSSTLYNAADRAGLSIVQRYSHSKRVAYVPPGRDATVSWYGPDFRFQNTYNQPILIRAKKYGGSIAFSIYSSDVINFNPRKIPEASKHQPDETRADNSDRSTFTNHYFHIKEGIPYQTESEMPFKK